MRILIVEDEETSRLLLTRIVGEFSECHQASDGKSGLEKVRDSLEKQSPYDLIFMDIMMPNMDGQSLLTAIRDLENQFGISQQSNVPVIMTSALDDEENVLNAHISGCRAYLVKPLNKNMILKEVKALGFAI